MAVLSKSVSVAATGLTLIYDPATSGSIGDKAGTLIRFADITSTAVLYLVGDGNFVSGVAPSDAAAVADGYPLHATEQIPATLFQGEKIYGISSSGTLDIRRIASGV